MSQQYTAIVLVASDKASLGQRADTTGGAVSRLLEEYGFNVRPPLILPDERAQLAAGMRNLCDEGSVALLCTAGGTGFSPRDCTPEATLDIAERLAPGLAEAMRAASLSITPKAILSRGIVAIRGRTLIVNLPGSPRGACENLTVILPVLGHGLDILRGAAQECASPVPETL